MVNDVNLQEMTSIIGYGGIRSKRNRPALG
jgi:hypothetical protein